MIFYERYKSCENVIFNEDREWIVWMILKESLIVELRLKEGCGWPFLNKEMIQNEYGNSK